jgi:hypothetical protein
MSSKALTHLIIAVVLTGSAIAGLQLNPSLASALVPAGLPLSAGSAPCGDGAMFLARAPDRFVASPAGLKLAPARVVRLTP